MGVDAATLEMMQKAAGMQPMQTAMGMDAFHRSLALPYDQLLFVEGDRAKLRSALLAGAPVKAEPQAKQPAAVVEISSGSLAEKTQEYLRKQFAGLLKLPSHKIDPEAVLETYGIDSVLTMKLTNQLEQTFGSLSKTLFFEYQTIAGLAGYLIKTHPAIVRGKIALSQTGPDVKDMAQITAGNRPPVPTRRSRNRFAGARANYQKDIAIIGVAGRYPQAENLQAFWKNLQSGRDCITEIPPERWDHKLYFDPDQNKPGKSYSK